MRKTLPGLALLALSGCHASHELSFARDAGQQDGSFSGVCFDDAVTLVARDGECTSVVVRGSGSPAWESMLPVEGTPARIFVTDDQWHRALVTFSYECMPSRSSVRIWNPSDRLATCDNAPSFGWDLRFALPCVPSAEEMRYDEMQRGETPIAELRVQGAALVTMEICVP